jgi:hypothetical protein
MKRFNKYTALVGTATAIMLVFAGIAVASNMGFKLNRALIQLDGGGAAASNWVSLPYNNSFADATALKADITNATLVSRWNAASAQFEDFTGSAPRTDVNFSVNAGTAYSVKVSADQSWIVVGSHAPGTGVSVIQLDGGGAAASNWISVPYHTTSTNATALKAEIPNSTLLSRWNPTAAQFEDFTGSAPRTDVNFTVAAGEGYSVKVSTNSTWNPAHY